MLHTIDICTMQHSTLPRTVSSSKVVACSTPVRIKSACLIVPDLLCLSIPIITPYNSDMMLSGSRAPRTFRVCSAPTSMRPHAHHVPCPRRSMVLLLFSTCRINIFRQWMIPIPVIRPYIQDKPRCALPPDSEGVDQFSPESVVSNG